MSFQSSQLSRCWLGPLPLTAYARNVQINETVDLLDVTVIEQPSPDGNARKYISDLDAGTFTANGPLDTAAGPQGSLFADLKGGTATPITYAPIGTDSNVWLANSRTTGLDATNGIGQTVDWSLNAQLDGPVDFAGVLLQLGTTTADGTVARVDNGAQSVSGGVAHLHIVSMTGITADVVDIQSSSDGTTYGTLLTFGTVTGTTSVRVEVSGTVARYLRVNHDVTGSGSIGAVVAFARR